MPGYSYWNGEYYFYQTEIIDLIKTVKIERDTRKNNKDLIATSFADDLIKALGVPLPEEAVADK